MRRELCTLMTVGALAMALSGCVSLRAHLEDRARVDQELPAGAEELYPDRAKTRKVVVVELQEKGRAEARPVKPAAAVAQPEAVQPAGGQSQVVVEPKETVVVHDTNFTFPNMNRQALNQPAAVASSAVEQYTVQKDDTLQKIAKKLYGSYSRWTMIYDANRDVIKDPNFLKPGTVLKIPLVTEAVPKAPPAVPEDEVK